MKAKEFIQYSDDLTSAYVNYEVIEAIAASEGRDEEEVRLEREQDLGCDGYDFVEIEYDGRMIFHKNHEDVIRGILHFRGDGSAYASYEEIYDYPYGGDLEDFYYEVEKFFGLVAEEQEERVVFRKKINE